MLRKAPPEEAFALQAISCMTSIWNAGAVPVICATQKRCCAADTESVLILFKSPLIKDQVFSHALSSAINVPPGTSTAKRHKERGRTPGSQVQLYFHQGSSTCAPVLCPPPCCRAGIPWGHQHPHGIVRHPGVPGQLRDDSLSLEPACISSSITLSRSLSIPLPQRRKYLYCHPPPLNSPGLPTSAAQSHGLLPAVKTQKRVSTLTMSQQPSAHCSPKAPQAAKDMLAGLLGVPGTNSCPASLGQRLKSLSEAPHTL